MFTANTQVLLPLFGFVFIGFGFAACRGYWKNWYWKPGGSPYGYIPLGCIFLEYGFQNQLEKILGSRIWLSTVLMLLFLALGIWWSIRPPSFLKPAWVRWIEKYPAAVIDAMRQSTKNATDWNNHLSSEAAVDAWVKTLKKN